MKKLAEFLTGFEAVILGLIVFVIYRYFEVQSLFYRYLPLEETTRLIASCMVALVVVFSLLVFSSHINQFRISKSDSGNWIKWVMFFFTLFINAFFWQVWQVKEDEKLTILDIRLIVFFKVIISLFFAAFDYAYNHLFIAKWNQSQALDKSKFNLAKMQHALAQLELKRSETERVISLEQAKLSELVAKQDPKVCPRCGKEFDNPNQRNGHLRSCKGLTINGTPTSQLAVSHG